MPDGRDGSWSVVPAPAPPRPTSARMRVSPGRVAAFGADAGVKLTAFTCVDI